MNHREEIKRYCKIREEEYVKMYLKRKKKMYIVWCICPLPSPGKQVSIPSVNNG